MAYIHRFFTNPNQSFFLFGPRGTGRSLWTKHNFKDALFIDLLEPDVYRSYTARPERLREIVSGNPERHQIVIDEIQKAPMLLSVIHSLIEEKKEIQFIITGSSDRKIKRTGIDILGGRALVRSLHPFMAAKLGNGFDLNHTLQSGLLPLIWSSKNTEESLKAYQGLYLREEVQMEALVRNIGNFSHFLEAIRFSHASVLNTSKVARECEVGRKTVEGYIEILEDLLLIFRVPVFTKRAKRELANHTKLYIFDAGVFRSLRPRGPLDRIEEINGAALEGLVAQHLRSWNAYRGDRNKLYYWRTRSGVEVDFVIYGEDGLWAIEVKNNSKIYPEHLWALKSFKEDYPESRLIFLYRGKERLKKGEISCIPCEEFLSQLHPNKNII